MVADLVMLGANLYLVNGNARHRPHPRARRADPAAAPHLSEWIEENTGRERTYLAAFCFVGYFVGSKIGLTKRTLRNELVTG